MDINQNQKKQSPKLLSTSTKKLLNEATRPKQIAKTDNAGLLGSPSPKTNSLASWEALEFTYYEKTASWYVVTALVGIILILYALFTKNPVMTITFILIFSVIFLYANKKPLTIKFSITPKGIKLGDRIYYFDCLESFWMFYNPPHVKYISLKSKKTLMPIIRIPLGKANPLEVRKILLQYLPEEEQHESLIDILARIVRF